MRSLLFVIFALQCPVFLFAFPPITILIIGAGPVGLFSAYKLVLACRGIPIRIIIIEEREDFTRPQVVRIPPSLARGFVESIQKALWVSEADIFGGETCIRELQGEFWNFLLEARSPQVELDVRTLSVTVENFQAIVDEHKADIVILATGDSPFTHELSRQTGTHAPLIPRDFTDTAMPKKFRVGVYLVFEADKQVGDLGSGQGLIQFYARSGTDKAQIYTYHDGLFKTQGLSKLFKKSIFKKLPESFETTAKFRNKGGLFLSGKYVETEEDNTGMSPAERAWFKDYVGILDKVIKKLNIPVPEDRSSVKVFFAERKEYIYAKAATRFGNRRPVILALGDSLRVTDYVKGFSLSRGLVVADQVIETIIAAQLRILVTAKDPAGIFEGTMDEIVRSINAYWTNYNITEVEANYLR